MSQIGTAEISFTEIGVSQIGTAEVGLIQGGVSQIGTAEVRFAEVRFPELGFAEVRFAEVRFAEVNIIEVGFPQIGKAQIDFPEVGCSGFNPAGPISRIHGIEELDFAEVGEVNSTQIGTAEIGFAEVGFNIRMLFPPLVPGLYSLFEDSKLFLVRHCVLPFFLSLAGSSPNRQRLYNYILFLR